MEWYIKGLRNYFNFRGRASREEFWMFTLVNVIILYGIHFFVFLVWSKKYGVIASSLYVQATMIPMAAMSFRRIHDIDESGLWAFVPILNFYLFCKDGTHGENRFGRDPRVLAEREDL
jgi:uncharacterized membrane protein YhaH (DUF805 family)